MIYCPTCLFIPLPSSPNNLLPSPRFSSHLPVYLQNNQRLNSLTNHHSVRDSLASASSQSPYPLFLRILICLPRSPLTPLGLSLPFQITRAFEKYSVFSETLFPVTPSKILVLHTGQPCTVLSLGPLNSRLPLLKHLFPLTPSTMLSTPPRITLPFLITSTFQKRVSTF